MAEILSQNEIDELLSALAAGVDEPEKEPEEVVLGQVREYNFRTANKFAKEHIRMLEFIYENFANQLSSYLSATLRVMSEAEVVSIEEQTFAEFSNSITSPVILSIISMPPLQGNSLLEITPTIAYEMISRLFGGTGDFTDTSKTFTEIELSVLRRISQQIIELMDESWGKVIKIKAMLERVETSAQYTQIIAASEPIVIVTLNVKIGKVSDLVNLCIPHVAVQPILKQLNMQTLYQETNMQNDQTESPLVMTQNLNDIHLTLHAIFDDTVGTVQDIINLQVGDVIRVDHPVNKPVTVLVEHMPKFKAAIGRHKSRYAVRVSDILKESGADE